MLRRQEKLKMNVLKEAAAFRQKKNAPTTDKLIDVDQIGSGEIRLGNQKNTDQLGGGAVGGVGGSGNTRNFGGYASPVRSGGPGSKIAAASSKSTGLTSPVARQSQVGPNFNVNNNNPAAAATANTTGDKTNIANNSTNNNAHVRQQLGLQEEKTAEEKAEEKKKMDMMK